MLLCIETVPKDFDMLSKQSCYIRQGADTRFSEKIFRYVFKMNFNYVLVLVTHSSKIIPNPLLSFLSQGGYSICEPYGRMLSEMRFMYSFLYYLRWILTRVMQFIHSEIWLLAYKMTQSIHFQR